MKIIIIGGVAAGTSAAAKARRNNENAQITLFDADSDVSYSGCGLPYFIGTEVEGREQLVPRDAAFFKQKYNVDVYTRHQVLEIQPQSKVLTVQNLVTQEIFQERYDKLVVATGAKSVVPAIEGGNKPNVFYLRNVINADRIREQVLTANPKSAVIVGSGFIGLEMAENLTARGIAVSVVEMAGHVMPALDQDMAVYVADHLLEKGVQVIVNDSVIRLEGEPSVSKVILKSGKEIDADFVIMAVGVRPNIELAQKSGIELGPTGAIKVNRKMQTNIDDIYACGDCAESYSLMTGKPLYRPLGSTANKMGRITGDQITGGDLEFRGILGTGIFKMFDMAVGQTGLTEKEAKKEGYEVVVCHNIKPDKPEYYHGSEMVIKAVADKNTGKVLGVQIVGRSGVDKRIDVFVTAITFGAKAEDLFHLDLAYAPPFSTTKDPVMYTGMILDNAIRRGRVLMTPAEVQEKIKNGEEVKIIDARVTKQYEKAHVEGAVNIPQENIRKALDSLDKEMVTVTYCNKGVTGNAAQNILINHGFKNVYNLSGGYKNYSKNSKK
ncbi:MULTISPECIES: FAD-dependent oxidoreductase [Pelosinus]|uniref:Pyridine nucleotide-disulfide oxidoreductase, FAD/NAD(P)-binding domain-containing protein n=1 Tax=Pelosinus fermentans B4 TaxID=1149862 RepID=I9B6L0_9FIRM|nr:MULTISPECIES: FAD-dependent oxidoreductase [Pelosinus]EIW20787.1 Pyridine nucleotide-disulfide oxidoreductase, FAD/NAD(P)-binding domain-containing protein [Pelosinus fermentans B4]EIW25368.1 FAD-dependent pyridine nucleotide-disulfide oxidoreductase [Pelosinus fermentans A11]OAM93626.1 CoA-disulfide reductase [Pelosinus fermentans DSM 17108]SDQ84460.1 NADPH-dependent 2,4-dienoyl-CoA reductase, sulfur reductase [Pelosinus fermentans]